MGILDVFKGTDQRIRSALLSNVTHAIESKRFVTIVTDGSWAFCPARSLDAIQSNYVVERNLLSDAGPGVFWTKVGAANQPEQLWVPR